MKVDHWKTFFLCLITLLKVILSFFCPKVKSLVLSLEIIFDHKQDVTHNVEIMCETKWFELIDDQLNRVINKRHKDC